MGGNFHQISFGWYEIEDEGFSVLKLTSLVTVRTGYLKANLSARCHKVVYSQKTGDMDISASAPETSWARKD